MSVVAGIDYSTHTIDIVLLNEDDNEAVWHRYPIDVYQDSDAFSRTREVRDAMRPRSWWKDQGTIAIGIEDPRGHGTGHLYRIQGAILACIPPDLLVQPWIPSAWRKQVGLKGNATKAEVQEHVTWRLNQRAFAWPQDACDAYAIAYATRSVLERQEAA